VATLTHGVERAGREATGAALGKSTGAGARDRLRAQQRVEVLARAWPAAAGQEAAAHIGLAGERGDEALCDVCGWGWSSTRVWSCQCKKLWNRYP
jgi:hypothetical protein